MISVRTHLCTLFREGKNLFYTRSIQCRFPKRGLNIPQPIWDSLSWKCKNLYNQLKMAERKLKQENPPNIEVEIEIEFLQNAINAF